MEILARRGSPVSFVLDSSIALALLYGDEAIPSAQKILKRLARDGAWVPSIWRLEIANSLQCSVRRKRIDAAFRDASLADLSALPIEIDEQTNSFAWSATLKLAERCGLTLYDASYLELALRLNLPLATLDKELRAAATQMRVPLLASA